MLFDEFCECTGDLSTGTEIEMKKYTKRNILEQRKTWIERQSHRWSIAAYQQIDRQEFQRIQAKSQRACRSIAQNQPIDRPNYASHTERAPIDRGIRADRSGAQWTWDRTSADRSRVISRSIGQSSSRSTTSFSKRFRFQNSSTIRSNLVLYK